MALNSPEFRKLVADAKDADKTQAAARAQEALALSLAAEARRIDVAERIAALRDAHQDIQHATRRTATLAKEVTELTTARDIPTDVAIRPRLRRKPLITGWLLGDGRMPVTGGHGRRGRDYRGSFLGTEGLLYDYVFYNVGPPHKWHLPRIVQDGGGEEIIEAYGDDTLKTRFVPEYKAEVLRVATTFLPGEPDTWMPEYPPMPKPQWLERADHAARRHAAQAPEIYRRQFKEAEVRAAEFMVEYTQANHEARLARFVAQHELLAE